MTAELRYVVIEESTSAHCCFKATVVDVLRPYMIRGEHYHVNGVPQFEAVCETFDLADAVLVAKALNEMEERK